MPAPAVAVGDVVECEKFPDAWYTAQVKQTRATDNKVLVHYDGWSTRWDEWVDPAKLAVAGKNKLGQVPGGEAPKRSSNEQPSSAADRSTSTRAARAAGVYDSAEVRALKQEVAELREVNAKLEERLTALELSGRKGGINVPPAALVASLQMLATAEAELGQDAEVQRNLKAQGMSKTVKKKPGLNSAELMVEACLRFATCMRAQAVENSKAQVGLIDTQLQMAREQKQVRAQLVEMQQLMMQGFDTASGLAATMVNDAGMDEPVLDTLATTASASRPALTPVKATGKSRTSPLRTSSSPDQSATKIQAAFRGKKERQNLDQAMQEGLQKIEESAVEIQRHWRGKKQRDELEAQYIAEVATLRQTAEEEEAAAQMREDAAVKVQAACKQDARMHLRFTESKTTSGRGHEARENYYDILDQNIAAEQVQAAWRGRRVRQAVEEGDFEFLGLGDLLLDEEMEQQLIEQQLSEAPYDKATYSRGAR